MQISGQIILAVFQYAGGEVEHVSWWSRKMDCELDQECQTRCKDRLQAGEYPGFCDAGWVPNFHGS